MRRGFERAETMMQGILYFHAHFVVLCVSQWTWSPCRFWKPDLFGVRFGGLSLQNRPCRRHLHEAGYLASGYVINFLSRVPSVGGVCRFACFRSWRQLTAPGMRSRRCGRPSYDRVPIGLRGLKPRDSFCGEANPG